MTRPQILLDLNAEISVDLFAGGGGASSGYERATGRQIDVAVNHDAAAVAMHRINHPATQHFQSDVFEVDPREVTGGRPVGLLWASPDCTFHSKARGAKPIRSKERKRRALAWVVTRWAGQVRPRVIMLENVEEFADWGPLVAKRGEKTGRVLLRNPPEGAEEEEDRVAAPGERVPLEEQQLVPCPMRTSQTFRQWVRSLERFGYQVEHRELRACDYGAPTIRKRFFLIARCDGRPIVWPEATHGPGRALPYRSAAECIDWSIPMLSIFATRAEARAWGKAHGQAAPVRPLAQATQRRIARGVMRYVVDNPKPFIVGVGGRQGQSGERSLESPMQTITSKGDAAVIAPVISQLAHGEGSGASKRWGIGASEYTEPLPTIHAGGNSHALVAPYLVPRYGEREGQEPRVRSLEEPYPAVVTTGNGGSLAAAFMAQHNTGMVGHHLTNPVSTIVNKGCTQALVAANLSHFQTGEPSGGQGDPAAPLRAITAKPKAGLVYAFLQAYYGTGNQQDPRDPLFTIPTVDRFGLVTVTVDGEPYVLTDIAMRMLQPRELYRAQGFRDEYVIDRGLFLVKDRWLVQPLTKTEQVRMCGNSVSPDVAEAIIRANLPEMLAWDIAPKKVAKPRRGRAVLANVA